MSDRSPAVDDIWERVRARLSNVPLAREARRLIDFPQAEAAAALVLLLASSDIEQMRELFSLLGTACRGLSAKMDADPSEQTAARLQTAILLAKMLGERIGALGDETGVLLPAAAAKQAAYLELSRRLRDLLVGAWKPDLEAEAMALIAEFSNLRAVDPADFLATEIDNAVAGVWNAAGDKFNSAGERSAATAYYRNAARGFETAGLTAKARSVRLKLIAMTRRLAVDFDETIRQIAAMLAEIEGGPPHLHRAEMRLQLADTYVEVGDTEAARAQLEAAEAESRRCGWPAPDLDDMDVTFARWVAHAEATCKPTDDFLRVLGDELMIAMEALAVRVRIAVSREERAAYDRPLTQVAALVERLGRTTMAENRAADGDRTAFFAEFGDQPNQSLKGTTWTETGLGNIAATVSLDADLKRVLQEFVRFHEAGVSADALLPRIEQLLAEARAGGLTAMEAEFLLLCADIHLRAGRFDAATAAGRTAYNLPRAPRYDLTIGCSALDRIISAGIASNDVAATSAACGEAIALLEHHRYNINAPYAQSAFLRRRAGYYTIGMDTALRCDDLDLFVQRADAFKAAGSLRNVGALPSPSAGELELLFRTFTEQIEQARQAGDAGMADDIAEKRRAVWDLLAIARARARSVATPPLTLAALQAALEPDEAAVSWYWIQRDLLLTLALDNRQQCVATYKIKDDERGALDEFADAVQSLQRSAGWIDQVRRFSPTLLPEKIHSIIKGKRRLILSPHRVLHALPLHALTWGGDLLIRRFAVSYAPNLSCLIRKHHAARERGVLAIGISDFAIPGKKLKPLSDCVPEAKAVATTWAGSSVAATKLLNEQATTSAVRRLAAGGQLTRLSCLHFATHGADVRGDNPMEAHLWLRDGQLDGLEIAMWQLEADLVVLSACYSGQRAIARQGTELVGDDIFGLQAALFAAGAARVLGALWPADSPTAAKLMADFHRRYVAGDSPEIALQAAMLDFLDNATPLTRAAYYWAPFYIAAVARPVPPNC